MRQLHVQERCKFFVPMRSWRWIIVSKDIRNYQEIIRSDGTREKERKKCKTKKKKNFLVICSTHWSQCVRVEINMRMRTYACININICISRQFNKVSINCRFWKVAYKVDLTKLILLENYCERKWYVTFLNRFAILNDNECKIKYNKY